MLNRDADAFVEQGGDALTVAVIGIALITQDADAAAGAHELGEFIEFFTRMRRREMGVIDPEQVLDLSGARRVPSFFRRAESAQMQVSDSTLVERGRELALGKPRPPRGRDRAHVDDEADPRAGELVQHRVRGRMLVADGQKRRHFSSRLNDMAEDGFNLGILTRLGVSERSFAAGQTIFHEGDTAEELFVIGKGRVDIRSGERLLNHLGENDPFGEMALVDKAPRSATAIAVTDVDLVPVGEKQFLCLVDEIPYFALKVMRVLARRLRAQNSSG